MNEDHAQDCNCRFCTAQFAQDLHHILDSEPGGFISVCGYVSRLTAEVKAHYRQWVQEKGATVAPIAQAIAEMNMPGAKADTDLKQKIRDALREAGSRGLITTEIAELVLERELNAGEIVYLERSDELLGPVAGSA